MFMSKIIKKIYHVRKYEIIDNEIERKKTMGENNVAFTEDEQHNNELNIIKDKE